jgi:hypothetical protein
MSAPRSQISPLFQILDVVGIAGVLLSITIFATGGFREWTPFGRVSMTSWVRPLLISLVFLGVRHWLLPTPTLFSRVRHGLARAWLAPEVRAAAPLVVGTRLGVFLVGFLAVALFGYRPEFQVPWRIYDNEILNLPARWDTGWYIGVAIEGYMWDPTRPTQQQNIAFFPVYPMLMRYGALLLGREVMWTGVLISWLSFFGALVYLFRLARARFGDDAASGAIALVACYPFALFFGTAYTEALFLLTSVAACYHFERRDWWRAALWGLATGLSRPNGCLLSVALGLMAITPIVQTRRVEWRPLATALLVAAMPGLGMLAYSAYIYVLTGHPLQWAVQNAAWGRVYRGLDAFVAQQAHTIGQHGLYSYAATRTLDAMQLAAVLFMFAMVLPVSLRVGLPYGALILVNLVPPLLMGGLLSMGRVTSVLFPAFLWLGAAIPASHRPAWLGVFAMLQAICAALFFTWRPLY